MILSGWNQDIQAWAIHVRRRMREFSAVSKAVRLELCAIPVEFGEQERELHSTSRFTAMIDDHVK